MKLSKTKIAIPAAIVVLALAAGGAQLWGQNQARTQVNALLAHLPGGATGRYEGFHFNIFTRTMRLSDVTISRNGAPILKAADAVFHHVHGAGTAENPFAAGKLRLDGLEVWRIGHHISASYVVGDKIALLGPGVPPPATTPRWLIRPDAGTLLSAASLQASAITLDNGATIGGISATGYDQGRLQQASLRDYANPNGDKLASLAANDIDLNGLDRVFDTGRYRPGAPGWSAPRKLVGHIDLSGLVSHDENDSAKIGHVAIDDFAGRPFALSPTGANTATAAFIQDAAQALSLGSASITGFTFQDHGMKANGSLGQMMVMGYGAGKLSLFSFHNLSVSREGAPVASIGHFHLSDVDAASLLAMKEPITLDRITAAVQDGGFSIGKLQIGTVAAHVNARSTVTLASFEETLSGSNPIKSTVSIKGLTVPSTTSPSVAQVLGPLGLSQIVFDIEESGSFDHKTDETTIAPFVLTAKDLGSLSLSGKFVHVPTGLADMANAESAVAKMGIGPFSLSFTNESLVQRIISMMAKQSGKSVAEVTSGAGIAAAFFAATVVPGQPDAGQQVAAFIAHPTRLVLTGNPPDPVPVAAFLGANLRAAQDALKMHLAAQ